MTYVAAAEVKVHRVSVFLGLLLAGPFALAQGGAVSAKPVTPPPSIEQKMAHMQAQLDDWAGLDRYRAEDAALPPPAAGEERVVFLGDSITDAWGRLPDSGTFFPGKPYLNRGISGQTTPQMLVRFEQDVVRLHPAVMVLLAGTNDIAGNTGPETPDMIEDNFRAMTAIAKANRVRVVLASILPAAAYPWKPALTPAGSIRDVNAWLQRFAREQNVIYLDYYSALADERGGMRAGTSKDGVHPNSVGYGIMAPLASKAISSALDSGRP